MKATEFLLVCIKYKAVFVIINKTKVLLPQA
jgi:hypothetical protein